MIGIGRELRGSYFSTAAQSPVHHLKHVALHNVCQGVSDCRVNQPADFEDHHDPEK
jgi:hypothetical protein